MPAKPIEINDNQRVKKIVKDSFIILNLLFNYELSIEELSVIDPSEYQNNNFKENNLNGFYSLKIIINNIENEFIIKDFNYDISNEYNKTQPITNFNYTSKGFFSITSGSAGDLHSFENHDIDYINVNNLNEIISERDLSGNIQRLDESNSSKINDFPIIKKEIQTGEKPLKKFISVNDIDPELKQLTPFEQSKNLKELGINNYTKPKIPFIYMNTGSFEGYQPIKLSSEDTYKELSSELIRANKVINLISSKHILSLPGGGGISINWKL